MTNLIKMLRIDERLVHGQVALIWSHQLQVDHIVVVNDKAANDPIQSASLKMATPPTMKAIVLSRDKAKTLFADPRFNALNSFIVVNNPQDARFVVETGVKIPLVNIGNFGRASKEAAANKKKYTENLRLSDQDVADLQAISDSGTPVAYQIVPDQQKIPLDKLIQKEA